MQRLGKAFTRLARGSAYGLASTLPHDWLQWLRERRVLKHVLETLDINCVIDVGANCGQFGMRLRGIGYRGWIVSFEPVRSNFEELKNVAERNGPWRVFPYALGANAGLLDINVTHTTLFSSFLTPNVEMRERFPENRVVRTETAEIWRLDDVIDNCLSGIRSPRIYLKLDTQGFDLEVIKGAETALADVVGVQTEISFKRVYDESPGFQKSLAELQARGFAVVDFLPVSSDLDSLSAVEMDCVMTRQESRHTTATSLLRRRPQILETQK